MDKEAGDNDQKKSVNTAGQRFWCIFFHIRFQFITIIGVR